MKEDFKVDKGHFCGEDYRRLVFDRFNTVPRESIDELEKEGFMSPSEAHQALETGLIGDIYSLHIAKKGFEQEFFVEDSIFALKENVDGVYLVRKSTGFGLDNDGNLIYKDLIIEPKKNLKEIFIREEKGKGYLTIEENGVKYFLRDSARIRRVTSEEGEIFFYIKNPWINKTKRAIGGFIVNEKDGFLLDKNGSLWFTLDTYQELSHVKIAEKIRIREIIKESIFIDYKNSECLKKSRLISETGSWYKDESGTLRKRRFISSKDFVHFSDNLDAVVFLPLSKENKIYPLGSYSLGRNYLWSKEEDEHCEIIPQKDVIEQGGDLVWEEIIALKGQYHFNAYGKAIIGSEILPYGTYLKFENGTIIEDTSGNFILANSCIKIINQTDSDAEFQPLTIPYINSRLTRNLWEDSPYLMYQPEISFANQGQSIFSKFNSWAQQIYRFTGRAFFNVFGESSAYGKMTKLIEAYVDNIVFKEAIPPIARTHDHWEAMHLKTALILSHPSLKAKNLIENTPHNFFAFLKRQEGWIGGDLILLEHESVFGIALDYLRALFCLLRFDFQGLRFWKNYSHKRIKHLQERYDSPSYIAKVFRIWTINRLIFCPFYYGIWLMLVGSFSLIIPGVLTVKSASLSWILFWSTLGILIVLSKVIVPFLERFLYYETKKAKFLIVIAATGIAIIINRLGEAAFPAYWKWLNSCILILYLIYQLVLNKIFPFLFFHNRNLLLSLKRILISITVFAVGWLYLPVILEYLSEFPSANWIFIFAFDVFPRLSGYFVSWIAILWLFPAGRTLLNLLRKSVFETIYSSSILLLNIIYVPITVFGKILFMALYPNRSIPWITSTSVEKLLKYKLSLEESYARLFWAPFFSAVFIICPVILGLADTSLLFYGWPVFVWSWFMGPYLAWFSGNFGEEEGFSSLELLTVKDKLYRWKKENYKTKTVPAEREMVDKILELSLRIKNTLSKREIVRLYLYILTDVELENPMLREAINKKLRTELAPEKLREYNWLTLNEISRAEIILRLNKNKILSDVLKNGLINMELIGACLFLVSRMGPRGMTTTEWDWLPDSRKLGLFNHTTRKYKLNENSRQHLKILLQLFTKNEFEVLLKNMKNQESISSLINIIPEEFIYLKTAVKEIDECTDLDRFSLHQKKNILGTLSLRYFPHEKNCLEILRFALKVKCRNPGRN
ncbi:MAG: hypothetical protein NTZ48_05125 [Candidatus Omnitrophica bacterium]|nr:hypothetical protein [Candidatus Omnitrophota bacterium]